jgi:1-acyl-sn-glycerol-3-phosphate acyltransferase
MTRLLRQVAALGRMLRLLAHALGGLWTLYLRFGRMSDAQQNRAVQQWAQGVLRIMGIGLQVHGRAHAGPVLLVANHISWLDIVVMLAAQYCRFVAKSELKAWPLVGPLATAAGTLYIERASSRDALRVVHHMAERLQAGDVLAVFPEGTTGDGVHVLPFHANLLQAAIAAQAPAQAVGLRFVDARGQPSFAPCYIGDDTFVGSVWRTLCARGLVVHVAFAAPDLPQGRKRRVWALDLRAQVMAVRGLPA